MSNDQKPTSIFGIWYPELCRRFGLKPPPSVRINSAKSTLLVHTDALKIEDWPLLIRALKQDTSLHSISVSSTVGNWVFLRDVDDDCKFRKMERKSGVMWTAHAMRSLIKAICKVLRNSKTISHLELDGLPMFKEYLNSLTQSLLRNHTVTTLSLSRCRILDNGCKILCENIRYASNVEVLDLTGCGLTSRSGELLANLIKYQQIGRCCEGWQNSLRYSNPRIHLMRGIKRLILNDNPFFGDDGLQELTAVLFDDLWIKAVDLQQCGITDKSQEQLMKLLKSNDCLQIFDIRTNPVSKSALEDIFELFTQKYTTQTPEKKTEFSWRDFNTTRSRQSSGKSEVCGGTRKDEKGKAFMANVHRAQSVPMLKLFSRMSVNVNYLNTAK